MTKNSAQTSTTQLFSLTRKLLSCAQAGDWDAVVNIERTRKPLLMAVFNVPKHMSSNNLKTLLNEILALDRQVLQLAEQRKGELAGLLRQASQGRVGLRAYELNSR